MLDRNTTWAIPLPPWDSDGFGQQLSRQILNEKLPVFVNSVAGEAPKSVVFSAPTRF